ncbi:NUDIX hydrolase [Aeromicrobium sp. A1-2]|uniref:NUDIX hydrolase n=1 Tax=Aeromicrobium sp. A1-2 TaxID=2107713 RepID=UPI001C1F8AC4|nr:NUDIX hydrolase [Aeromicrobium sp. A1-2]
MTETLRDDDLELEPTTGSPELTDFAIVLGGDQVGTVTLRGEDSRTASIRWDAGADNIPIAVRALRLALAHAFGELGMTRVETRIPVDRTGDVRAASIAGMRREGIVRGAGSDPDRALLARIVGDPEPYSRDGFIAILNAGLPTKRVISQGLLRDERGRVLLCELTYKKEWDLPGGVVEVGEAPAIGLVRELHEELGVTVEVRDLITVNWLPAWRSWDDACIFLFDLGVVDSSITEGMTLQPSEIKSVRWCDPETVRTHAAAAAIELLEAIDAGAMPTYREAPKAAE